MNKNIVGRPVIGLFIILYLVLLVYNIFNYDKFLEIPLYNMINIAIAIIVAYYFVQKKNDERKLKEIVEDIVGKIQDSVNSELANIFQDGNDRKRVLRILRSTNNRIEQLNNIKEKLNLKDEVEYINEKYNCYREFIGDNLNQLESISQNGIDLHRLLSDIEDKCDELRIKMYK
jgi:hypothetical protein